MSEEIQPPLPRSSRAERITWSCNECRRRKQKCNQGQPCSNCARRFPPPVCDYRQNSRRPGGSLLLNPQQQPAVSISLFPPDDKFDFDDSKVLIHPLRQPSPRLNSWTRRAGEDVGEVADYWAGVGSLSPSPGSSPFGPYAWSTSKSSLSASILACEEDCTSHSQDVHAAVKMLRMYRPSSGQLTQGGWNADPDFWATSLDVPPIAGGGMWPMGAPLPAPGVLGVTPMPLTVQTSELLATYVKLISPFKASIDGNPDPSNPYLKNYVPYTVQSPLLVHVAIYTAACFLTETGHLDADVALTHKGFAIKLLNDHIRSMSPPSDEGIAGVTQLIVDEWLWGDPNNLHSHLRGLRELIRAKGGFRNLGQQGLISKLAITSDIAIALSFETNPFLRGAIEFEYHENIALPFRLSLNTPFVSSLARFAECDEALRIHPAVAAILDDMRFLLSAVIALPEHASSNELQKVYTTSAWIYDRTSNLPAGGPIARRRLSSAASVSPSSAGVSSPGFDARRTPETGDEQLIPPGRRGRQATSRSRSRGRLQQGGAGRASLQAPAEAQSPTAGRQSPPGAASLDFIYQAVRLAALMYSKAVKLRQPFSTIISTDEFIKLWTTTWRVPLSTWRSMIGVFNWILVPLVTCGKRPHDRFVKALLNGTLFQMGMENWDLTTRTMEGALKLQRWLRSEPLEETNTEKGGPSSHQEQVSEGQASERGEYGRAGNLSGSVGSGKGKEARNPSIVVPRW